jgi:hypothetical protein
MTISKYAKIFIRNEHLLTSTIIALSPFIATFVPLLGMNQLMISGMQPIFTTLLLFAVSYIIQIGMKVVEPKESKDIDLSFVTIDSSFLTVLAFTLAIEFLAQMSASSMKRSSQVNIVVDGLEKFYKKHDLKFK